MRPRNGREVGLALLGLDSLSLVALKSPVALADVRLGMHGRYHVVYRHVADSCGRVREEVV